MMTFSRDAALATDPQTDYAACPVNFVVDQYCCEMGEKSKATYTLYDRPHGGEFAKYYEDGWALPRQINFPDAFYSPKSPQYVYGDKAKTCRMLDVVQADGTLHSEMQCSWEPKAGDKRFVYNGSVADGMNFTQLLWSATQPRNNYAQFPIGAKCYSIMLADGTVNQTAQAACGGGFFAGKYRLNSFHDPTYVAIYVLYAVCFALIAFWVVLRATLAKKALANNSAPLVTVVAAEDLEGGNAKLLSNRGGPKTPGTLLDATLIGDDKASLWRTHEVIAAQLAEPHRLALKPKATRLLPVSEGVPWLGMRTFPGTVRVQHEGRRRLFRKVAQSTARAGSNALADEAEVARARSLCGHLQRRCLLPLRRAVCGPFNPSAVDGAANS